MHPPSYSWFPSILCVGFAVCIVLYVLAGFFFFFFLYGLPTVPEHPPHTPLPPFSGGDLISLLQASENKTACVRVCVCLGGSGAFVCARTRIPGQADLPHLRSAL